MNSKVIFMHFSLSLLCCLSLEHACANAQRAATEHTIDLMHLMLERILAEADVASNFVIAPQELLALYLQLHGTDKELAAATANTFTNDQLSNVTENIAVHNEVDTVDNGGDMKQNETLFRTTGSPISVYNTLYSDAYNSQRLRRKLKNLQFVLHEESDDVGGGVGGVRGVRGGDGDGDGDKCSNIENNFAAVVTRANTLRNNKHRNTNNDHSQHNNCNELMNAVRINSRWAHNFQKRDTHKRQFYMPQRHTHVYLNAMHKDDIFPYAELEDLDARALELSLQREQMKILIILPRTRNGLSQLLQRLSANVTLLNELCGITAAAAAAGDYQRRQLEPTLVRVFLPKFQYSQRTVLNGIFQQLLNATANVHLHWPSAWQVTQELHFAVNEDGIGDLQPSMVMFWNAFSSLRTKPVLFCVDHPFVFIVHNRQGIQLLGHLAQLRNLE